MSSLRARDVLDFLAARGFDRAAAALREDLRARGDPDWDFSDLSGFWPPLPPVRTARGHRDGDSGASASSSSSSSDAFLSMGSSPSELLNPYGVWSPTQAISEDSSVRYSEFGTARNIFSDSHWYNDQFGEYLDDSYFIMLDIDGCHSEDKFVMTIDAEEKFGKQDSKNFGVEARMDGEEYSEMISCSFPLCDCCSAVRRNYRGESEELIKNSSSAIYGRYQLMSDETERLDECGDTEFELKQLDESSQTILWNGNPQADLDHAMKRNNVESQLVEKELQVLNPFPVHRYTYTDRHPPCEGKSSVNSDYCFKASLVANTNNEKLQKEEDTPQFYPDKASKADSSDAYESRDCGPITRESHDPKSIDAGFLDHGTNDEHEFCDPQGDEYEIFDLRIIHQKNRTGFEENKDFPIVLNSVIAGRYYVTEYLGSAAFSKVVEALDLQTGVEVCLKIIKNDKDFFDQSLDEIKLLKFVNKHDPADEHHILRLYDYFYLQEHLFIVCELLNANLYEFQKYNQDSGGEVYFTLPRIQSIARQCLEALEYLHCLRIIHCDLKPENILLKSYSKCEIKVIDLGSSCFQTDKLYSYVQSRSYRAPEVILGLSYDPRIDIWSLGCILAELYSGDVLFANDSLVMILARMIGILGPIDMEMLMMGQETHKYFTDDYDLYHRNEETDQIEYLIPEKSSLTHQLQVSDTIFIDFLEYLLQIDPRKRPTATQALQHQWLSFPYH